MAAAWAVPSGLVVGGLAAWLQPAFALPLLALTVLLSVSVFLLYDRIPGPRRALFALGALLLALTAVVLAGGGLAAGLTAALASVFLTLLLTYDYSGSTPIEGGSHFEEHDWQIRLDLERCKGVYSCWAVCPEACFEKQEDTRVVSLAHDDRCIRCGACVVQCPMDALALEDGSGRRIEPDTIRRYKLNLLGQRSVGV